MTRNVPVGDPDFGEAFPCRCQVGKLRKDVDVLRRYSNLVGLERISLADTQPQGLRGGSADPGRFAEAFEAAGRFAENPLRELPNVQDNHHSNVLFPVP